MLPIQARTFFPQIICAELEAWYCSVLAESYAWCLEVLEGDIHLRKKDSRESQAVER